MNPWPGPGRRRQRLAVALPPVRREGNQAVLVPEGYHPVAAAPGYNTYYLNFLAGSAQSLANSDDPAHAWIKDSWREKDPRAPMVSLAMENAPASNSP